VIGCSQRSKVRSEVHYLARINCERGSAGSGNIPLSKPTAGWSSRKTAEDGLPETVRRASLNRYIRRWTTFAFPLRPVLWEMGPDIRGEPT
jgi:hypothetical protein